MGLLNFEDPQSAGLMGLASGLLSASGPSHMPISMGQALGAGIDKAGMAYQAAQKDRREELAYKLAAMQAEQQLAENALIMPYLKAAMGQAGGSPSAAPSGNPVGMVGPAAFGPSGVGTSDNQIPLSQVNPTTPIQAPQSPQIGGMSVSDLIQSKLAERLGGKAAAEAMWKWRAPNEKALTAINMGLQPSTPAYAEFMATDVQQSTDGKTSARRFVPGQGFQVSVPAGAVEAYKTFKGADDAFAVPTVVQTREGPVLSTPSQQRAAANGGTDPAMRVPPAVQKERDSTAASLVASELQTAQARLAKAQASGDLVGISNANKEIAALQKEAKLRGLPLQTESDKKVEAARGEAAVNASKVRSSSQELLAAIDNALKINDKTPYGPFGLAELQSSFSSLPAFGNGEKAKYAAQWDQLMGQKIMAGIASSGLGRMDIPIVKAIKEANGVPMELHPEARKAKLEGLRDAVLNHIASSQNEVAELNQPGITDTTQTQPMKLGNTKVATLADIQATAKATGKTTAQVTADLKKAGYTIGGQ